MHLHLTNCHGEWLAIAVIAAHAPFIGMWVRSLLPRLNRTPNPESPENDA